MSCLLNLKECWGHEDGLLFIATNFLFKRALLLCFLSRFCCFCLTSSLFFPYSCTMWKKRVGKQNHNQVWMYTVFRDQGQYLFYGAFKKGHAQNKLLQTFKHVNHTGVPTSSLIQAQSNFSLQYDSIAEWRLPLSDFPPSPGHLHPPPSFLPPPTQWHRKGIPHYPSFCLTKHTSCKSEHT